MKPNKIAQEWLEKADEDFGFASVSIDSNSYFSQICFHFQQAAEKYLKTFIVANELQFRPVHNLLELLDACKQEDLISEELEEACHYLNPFYIDTRYPVHWPTHYDKQTAIQAQDAALIIQKWVKANFKA